MPTALVFHARPSTGSNRARQNCPKRKRVGPSKGLGVSHLDILVEAGEITEEEATEKGAVIGKTGPVGELCAMIEAIDFSDPLVLRAVRSQLRFWIEVQSGKDSGGE